MLHMSHEPILCYSPYSSSPFADRLDAASLKNSHLNEKVNGNQVSTFFNVTLTKKGGNKVVAPLTLIPKKCARCTNSRELQFAPQRGPRELTRSRAA